MHTFLNIILFFLCGIFRHCFSHWIEIPIKQGPYQVSSSSSSTSIVIQSSVLADTFFMFTVTRAGDKMKLFCSINALLLHHAANCIIMDTSFHIWLNLFSEMNDRVIYGYWMSPDLEDGWGFVEAAVDIPH